AAHGAATAVGGAEEALLATGHADEEVGAGFHAAADDDGLSDALKTFGDAGHAGGKGPCGAFAVDQERPLAAINFMLLELGGVVGDIIDNAQSEVLGGAAKD